MAVKPPTDESDKRARAQLAMDNASRFFDVDEEEEEQSRLVGDGLPDTALSLIARCTVSTAWLGLIVGAVDAIYLTVGLKVHVTSLSFLLLGGISVACFGVLGVVLGLAAGFPLWAILKRGRPSRFAAVHFSTVGFLMFGAFFWTHAVDLIAVERVVPGVVLSCLPVLLWPVLWMNALPRFRRVEMRRPTGVPWWLVSIGITLVMLLGACFAYSSRNLGGADSLESDPNVVVITVDGLRADFASFPSSEPLGDLLRESAQFENVLAPHSGTLAAHASIMSGLHPFHHEALGPNDRVKSSIETLPRVMKREGFSTAAFVSTPDLVSEKGLSLGFYTYDDSLGWRIPGFGNLLVSKLPIWPRGEPVRGTGEVSQRFSSWLSARDGGSFLAWIHMDGPSTSGRDDYGRWIGEWSRSVVGVQDALKQAGAWDNTVFVIIGTHGLVLEPNDVWTGREGLRDDVSRVPLVIRYPGKEHGGVVVTHQVRTYDLYATILQRLELVPVTEHEGTPLADYLDGSMEGSLWCVLIGVNGNGGSMLGLRHQGFKYILDLDSEEEWLFDIGEDPSESQNLVNSQPELLKQVRGIVGPDRARLSVP